MALPAFPSTHEEKLNLVRDHCQELLQRWRDQRFSTDGELWFLVYRPGDLWPEGRGIQAVHRVDQVEAFARDNGGVPAALTLTDLRDDDYVVARATIDAEGNAKVHGI